MIHDPQHTLTDMDVLPPLGLRLTFADGATLSVDLAPTIRTHRTLGALADPALFAKARLDSRGGYVIWIEGDLEMAADNLRNLAIEQAGGIGHDPLANWMAEHGLTHERAADGVGISRRMLNYYLACSRPISKTLWLACLGWAAEREDRLAAAQARGAVRTGSGSAESCRGCGHTSHLRSNLHLTPTCGNRPLSVDSLTALWANERTS